MYKETLDFFERQPAPGTEELKMLEDVHCVPTKKKTYKYCKCPKNKCKIIMVACWSWFPSLRTDKLGIVSHKKNKRRHLINDIFLKHLKP